MTLPKNKPNASDAWKGALTNKYFRLQFIITLIALSSFTFIFNHFFDFVESRSGTQLRDPILEMLPAIDVSWGVFFILYSSIVIAIVAHRAHPKTIMVIFQTYILVTFVRMVTITMWPLEAPEGYLPLREPVVQFFTNGGKIISKDLFFSGHASTVLSVFFGTTLPRTRKLLTFCVVTICLLLLIQHVHYTIDVLFAFPATWIVYKFCKKYLGGK